MPTDTNMPTDTRTVSDRQRDIQSAYQQLQQGQVANNAPGDGDGGDGDGDGRGPTSARASDQTSDQTNVNNLCYCLIFVAVVVVVGAVILIPGWLTSTPSSTPSPSPSPTPSPSPAASSAVEMTSAVLPAGSGPNEELILQLFKMLQLAVKGAVTSLCAEFGVKGGVWLNATDWNKTTNPLNKLTVFGNTVCAMGETSVDLVNGLTWTNFSLLATSNATIDVSAIGYNVFNKTTQKADAKLFWTKPKPPPPTPAPAPPTPAPPTPAPTPAPPTPASTQALVGFGPEEKVHLFPLPAPSPFLQSMKQVGNLLYCTANDTLNLEKGIRQMMMLFQASGKFDVTVNFTKGDQSATATAPVTISGATLLQRFFWRMWEAVAGTKQSAVDTSAVAVSVKPLLLEGVCFPGVPCAVKGMFSQMDLTMSDSDDVQMKGGEQPARENHPHPRLH